MKMPITVSFTPGIFWFLENVSKVRSKFMYKRLAQNLTEPRRFHRNPQVSKEPKGFPISLAGKQYWMIKYFFTFFYWSIPWNWWVFLFEELTVLPQWSLVLDLTLQSSTQPNYWKIKINYFLCNGIIINL